MPDARKRLLPLLCLPMLPLASCQTLSHPPDPHVAELARSFEARSQAFFAALAASTAPDCDFAHNAPAYAELAGLAGQLQAATTSPTLHHAAQALVRAVAATELSHRAASAVETDPAGACLAGEAIALNADALARASRAIAMSQTAGGER